jgi:UDP-glucose 4-epimerase
VHGGELSGQTDWRAALDGVQAVVHAAARVHVMRETAGQPLAEFRRVNVDGTLRLARQAAESGVRRFVFISSIKVNGEETAPGRPFTEHDVPRPRDPYGISKLEAEQGLWELSRQTGMEVVVIRPVLVYGPGVRGNVLTMLRWLRRGLPVPLGAVHNKRSLVALDNLVDLTMASLAHPAAAGRTLLVSDDHDVSTTELLQRMAAALKVRARLIPVPVAWLRAAATIVGHGDLARRLCGSLQVSLEQTQATFGWRPRVGLDAALEETARHFLAHPG